jgi:leader peptidase (prepilin peptidase)/N-methyltransferase
MVWIWVVFVFLIGAAVGSFLNVCIYRIPLEKSIFWPRSRCGNCFQPVRGYDNIPLVSYLLLRGRCRTCKARFSPRYFLVELLTALAFVGLFYLEVVVNVNGLVYDPDWRPHPVRVQASFPGARAGIDAQAFRREHERMLSWQRLQIERGQVPWRAWAAFAFHAALLSFLIVVTFCDLDRWQIPLSVTALGTVVGLIGSALLAWPWPYAPEVPTAAMPPGQAWWKVSPFLGPLTALYPWPVWGPLPDWLPPGYWRTGLATGVAGMLAGTLMLRTVRFLFTHGLGKEAMGVGDADLMMMAGAFLGWQLVPVAFLLAAPVALSLTLGQFLVIQVLQQGMIKVKILFPKEGQPGFLVEGLPVNESGLAEALDAAVRQTGKANVYISGFGMMAETITAVENAAKKTAVRKVFLIGLLPFGPSLAIASLITLLAWHWIGPILQPLFFFGNLMVLLAVGCCVIIVVASYFIRLIRLMQE